MNKLLPILILLILVSASFAQTPTTSSAIINKVKIKDFDSIQETEEVQIFTLEQVDKSDLITQKCWTKFDFVDYNDSSNSVDSRYILMERSNYITFTNLDYLLGKLLGTLPKEKYQIIYWFDNSESLNTVYKGKFEQLCTNSTLMVAWYGSYADSYYWNITLDYGNPFNINSPYRIRDNVRSNLTISDYGNNYLCFNTTNEETVSKTPWSYSAGGIQYLTENFTVVQVPIMIRYTCQNGLLSPFIGARVTPSIGTVFNQVYEYPRYPIIPVINVIIVKFKSAVMLGQNTLSFFISQGILIAAKELFTWFGENFEKLVPGQLILILKALQEFINLVIVVISFYLMLEVSKKYVAFTSMLKSSLMNSAIVFSQLIVWMIVLMLFLYTISNMVTFCGLKSGVTLFLLNTMGVGFKTPQSITDAPQLAWDIALIMGIGMASADCTNYLQVTNMEDGLKLPTTYIDLMNSNISILIRGDVILIIVFIILIVLGILWNMAQYLRRKAEKMEDEVRTDRRNAEGYYTNEEEDEY